MRIGVSKSYKVLRFLNMERGPIVRGFLAILLWMLVFGCTFKPRLATHVFNTAFRNKDTMAAFRKAVWFLHHSWIGIRAFDDPFYDFAQDFNAKEARQCRAFFARKMKQNPSLSEKSDDLLILSKQIEHAILSGTSPTGISQYEDQASAILAQLNFPTFTAKPQPIRDGKHEGDFDVDGALTALQDFYKMTQKIDLPWYVISGTFLGLIREASFLKHDFDIDIGMNAEDVNQAALFDAIANSEDFFMRKFDIQRTLRFIDGQPSLKSNPTIIKLVHKNGISIDMFYHYNQSGKIWHGSSFQIWENTPFETKAYAFYNLMVFGPKNADLYLTENYGDWRTPVKTFNSTADTPNLSIVKNLSSLSLVLKKLVKSYQAGDPQTTAILDLLKKSGFVSQEKRILAYFIGRLVIHQKSIVTCQVKQPH